MTAANSVACISRRFFSVLIKIFYLLVYDKTNPSPTAIQSTALFREHLNRGSTVCKNYFTETWKMQIPTRGSLLYDVVLDQSERGKL